uniref:Uncharacterized protein n=1 Tax=viral metagenome TaxID=1070528 RepID=A0A6C0HUQ0_9ZZZZ
MTTIFTRYLYEYSHVQHSLIWALLERQRDEALFWTYEMYFSGFREETFQWLWDIYQYMYQELSPHLAPILIHLYRSSEDDDTMVGSWILYLLSSPISLTRYMREKHNVYLTYPEITENENVLLPPILMIPSTEVDKYRTVTEKNSEFCNWQILRNVCRFPLRAERICNGNMSLLERNEDDKLSGYETIQYMTAQGKTMRRKRRILARLDLSKMDSWMYYASFCPLWLERIQEHRGQICHETQRVWFDEEDDEEAFHSDYDLEPDEQPRSVQETILSPPVYRYISWKSFYEMYGSNSHLRKIRIRRDRQGNWHGIWSEGFCEA